MLQYLLRCKVQDAGLHLYALGTSGTPYILGRATSTESSTCQKRKSPEAAVFLTSRLVNARGWCLAFAKKREQVTQCEKAATVSVIVHWLVQNACTAGLNAMKEPCDRPASLRYKRLASPAHFSLKKRVDQAACIM